MGKEKKVWSQLQDMLLKRYYQVDQMRNWSLIAKRMTQQNNTPKKSGKQCRQRYQNHIDASIVKIQWTKEQEFELINLHNDIGNKWACIAQKLPGKSDNCVKNHFYSKLRKILRKLNKVIHRYFKKQFKQININVIYKLVEATEERFKANPSCSQEVSLKCRETQNKLLQLAIGNFCDQDDDQPQNQDNLAIFKNVIKQVYSASKQYKRKSKKSRNQSIQAPNVKKRKEKTLKNILVVQDKNAPSDGYLSDRSEQYQDSQESVKQQHVAFGQNFIVNENEDIPQVPQVKKIQIKEGKEGIESLLRDNNILQNQMENQPYSNPFMKFSSRSSFKSYSEKGDQQSDNNFFNMFDSSDIEVQTGKGRKSSPFVYFSQKMDDNKSVTFSQKQ